MKISEDLFLFTASIAADPVSPDVAPMIVSFLLLFFKNSSKAFPKNCKAMSLKAKVGP